jgi:predicted nucleotide-binding protein
MYSVKVHVTIRNDITECADTEIESIERGVDTLKGALLIALPADTFGRCAAAQVNLSRSS